MLSSLIYLQTFYWNDNSWSIWLPAEVPGWLIKTLYVNIGSFLGVSYPRTSVDYSYVKAPEIIRSCFFLQIVECVAVENWHRIVRVVEVERCAQKHDERFVEERRDSE